MLQYEWPDSQNREGVLELVAAFCLELHSRITATYFDYPVVSGSAT